MKNALTRFDPADKVLSHSLMISILCKDATVKQIAVNYNAVDKWSKAFDFLSIGKMIQSYMYPIISKDTNAYAISAKIIDNTGNIITRFRPILISRDLTMYNPEQSSINN